MPVPVATETSQTEAEGQDSSDKPPHDPRSIPHPNSIPLPPPEAGTFTHTKEPGNTRRDLIGISTNGEQLKDHDLIEQHVGGSTSSPPSSPTLSDSEWSTPSTRPNSQAASRAQSMSESARPPLPVDTPRPAPPRRTASSAGSATASSATAPAPQAGAASAPPTPAIKPRSRAGSIASDKSGESHKFTLKDLLASGPKLARRSSQKSVGSSKKSDSDGERKSVAGDSVGSLSAKYGVCQKIAIGKGATSVVRLAHKWDRTEEKLYAVKEFRKRRKNETEKEYVKKLTAEFCISSTLHHVNIVETVDLVQDEQKKWCEVMEFCPGGDLYAAIKKGGMSPSEVECCFKQILNGVGYLHSQGVAHRDIKPENLFFDTKGHLKIGDYGASTVYRLPWEQTIHMSTGLCGSEPYIAPEQFLGKPYDARLVDIWACGIVYYCLHFQELPWRAAQQSDSMYATYAEACLTAPPATSLIPAPPTSTTNDSSKVAHHSSTASSKNAPSNCPQTISLLSPRACRPVIRKMLEPNPKLRCSIEEVLKAAWIVGIEVCYLVDKPSHIHTHARALADAKVQRMD